MKEIILLIFSLLDIKYTKSKFLEVYKSNPNNCNLLGASQILSEYNIESVAIKTKTKDLISIKCPIICQFYDDLILLTSIDEDADSITFFHESTKQTCISINEFEKGWSGVALLISKLDNSGEKGYYSNLILKYLRIFTFACIVFMFTYIISKRIITIGILNNYKHLISLCLNVIGLLLCSLLLYREIYISADSKVDICTSLKQGNCSKVLESKMAKILGFSLSQIGFSFFAFNIIVYLLFSNYTYVLDFLYCLCIPFSIWSILYQKYKIKYWCLFCILVQATIVLNFTINMLFGIETFHININLIIAGIIYLIILFVTNNIIKYIKYSTNILILNEELFNIKYNPNVFNALLSCEKFVDRAIDNTILVFGNQDAANEVTIISNPFCHGCQEIHRLLKTLLLEDNDIKILFYFDSFNSELEHINKIFISTYLEFGKFETQNVIDEWFDTGIDNKSEYISRYCISNSNLVNEEIQKQKSWIKEQRLFQTPAIVVNGFLLPKDYSIIDLKYLL